MKENEKFDLAVVYGLAALTGAIMFSTNSKVEFFYQWLTLPLNYMIAVFVVFGIGYSIAGAILPKINEAKKPWARNVIMCVFCIVIIWGEFFVAKLFLGGIRDSAEQERQEKIQEMREEDFKRGAKEATEYIQEYISSEYSSGDWYYLDAKSFMSDWEEECPTPTNEDVYWLLEYVGENNNRMYYALDELLGMNGWDVADYVADK